ncbi:MAG: hypothetical protein J6K20_06405 [Thermoguttaceae bacterium]|nr:hypothetical protein [Thermoguttaceae bacterium]
MNLPSLRTPSRSSLRLVLLCAALGGFPNADATRFVSTTNAAEPPRAVWTPPSFDEFSVDLRFADALVSRRLVAQADAELARLESSLSQATQNQRFQFGNVAVRAAVESSRLLTADDRAAVAARIGAVRAAVEPGFAASSDATSSTTNPLQTLDFDAVLGPEPLADAALEYAAALVRAFYELGVLDVESNDATSLETTSDATDATFADSPFLSAAFETSTALVRRLPPEKSRLFVYWSAKTLLARADASADDAQLYRQATQAAKVLCADADKRRDAADYFFARLLLVETARRQGDVETATRLIGQTLDDASQAPNDDDAPQELAVALVAEEIRLLSLESKPFDAAKLASTDVDLLNRPTTIGPARFADRFFDVFADRDFARVAAFLNAASALADSETSENAPSSVDANDATVSGSSTSAAPEISPQDALAAARAAADRLPTNFWRARASLLLRETSVASADWRTTEAVAEERFRADDWEAALAEYDRAADAAKAAGDDADAFRLAATAAGIVDKILRDRLFKSSELSSTDADFWRLEAARRFAAAARSRPDDELAPRLFLLAIQRAQDSENAALNGENNATSENGAKSPNAPDVATLRRDYLTLFPTAENRGAFANESARLALADGKLDGAAFYVDAVSPDDPVFSETLALADALARAQFAAVNADSPDADAQNAAAFADAVKRFLAKTTAAPTPDSAAETPLAVQVKEAAEKLTAENSTPTDDAVLTRLFDLPRPTQIAADAELIAAFETLLDRWDAALADAAPERAALRADVQAKRLALRLDAGQTDAVLRDLANLEEATQSAGLETLERLLIFAEKTPRETKIKIGNAALASLDAPKTGQSAQNTQIAKAAQEKRSLIRARALRLAGKTQESLTLFAQIRRQNPKNLDATLGIAEILTAQNAPKALEQAVRYWSDAADLVPVGSPAWWDAKERVVEIYVRTDRRDQARKMLRTLWLTRSDASDPNRRARWERLVGAE